MSAFTFPNDPLLVDLLTAARATSPLQIVVQDVLGFEKSYSHLMGDIEQTRQDLLAQLPSSSFDKRALFAEIQNVGIMTRSAYEFMVAFFAVRAVGGAAMPLASGLFPEEAQYILSLANATCLLVGRDRKEAGEAIRSHIQDGNKSLNLLPISCDAPPLNIADLGIDETMSLNPDEPGLIMFTSGTTGRPKGVVLRRRLFSGIPGVKPGSTTINYRPIHWLGGAGGIIVAMLTGKKLYALGEKSGAVVLLDALRDYTITHAVFSPPYLRRMKDVITSQGVEERAQWRDHFKSLEVIRCTAGVLEPTTVQFWTDLTGLPFENRYSATEFGGMAITGIPTIQGSIGTAAPGVEVKLAGGNQGEICIKSPNMFLRYLGGEEMTRAAFDHDGYYKTGDVADKCGDEYVFRGRASSDYIMCGIQKISIVTVENCLLDLSYVAEACIVGVADYARMQLCGAVVRLHQDIKTPITLDKVKSDLASTLVPYMMPTLLRILGEGEEIPRNASGKVMKNKVLKEFFGKEDGQMDHAIPADVEQCAPAIFQLEGGTPWFASGLQRA